MSEPTKHNPFGPDATSELRKLAESASSAKELALLVANLTATPKVLQDIRNGLANHEIIKALGSGGELARTLAALSAPKVDLHLPEFTGSIRASLPRPLTETESPNYEVPQIADNEPSKEPSVVSEDSRIEILSSADLGLLVRRAREGKRLSQQDFADLAGVGRRFVSEMENGKPTLEFGKVLKVARAAGISVFASERPSK